MTTKPTTQGAPGALHFSWVSLERLTESKTNPRQFQDDHAMAELVQSVQRNGILTPLLVRPMAGADRESNVFEIICGARRFRAAKALKMAAVPVQTVEMTDEQVLEVQIIENLQRADIHPLDEATGYQAMRERLGISLEQIAARVSKTERYVYDRMKLTALTPEARKLFLAGRMHIGHASLLARLQPKDQKEAIEEEWDRRNRGEVPGIYGLKEWIERNVLLELAKAPWKKDDAHLVPKAGSCLECPKRTGADKFLFPEIKAKDLCTDPACFNSKMDAHLVQVEKSLDAAGIFVKVCREWVGGNEEKELQKQKILMQNEFQPAAKKSCPHTIPALVVRGPGVGTSIYVCTERKCKEHHSYSSLRSSSYSAERHKARAKQLVEHAWRWRVCKEVAQKVSQKKNHELTGDDWTLALEQSWSDIGWDEQKQFAVDMGWVETKKELKHGADMDVDRLGQKKLRDVKPEHRGAVLVLLALARHTDGGYYDRGDPDPLLAAAKRYRVDALSIKKEVVTEMELKRRAKKPKKAANAAKVVHALPKSAQSGR